MNLEASIVRYMSFVCADVVSEINSNQLRNLGRLLQRELGKVIVEQFHTASVPSGGFAVSPGYLSPTRANCASNYSEWRTA